MNFKNLFVILAACIAGFLGGTVASNHGVEAAGPTVIRASKFELVNRSGVPLGSWEVDSNNEVHLRFQPNRSITTIDIGVLGNGRPLIRINGRDRKNRIAIELDQMDKPMLVMSDERWEGRVLLGFSEPDSPSADWDNWGLSFRVPGSGIPLASIGLVKSVKDRFEGLLTISGKRIPE